MVSLFSPNYLYRLPQTSELSGWLNLVNPCSFCWEIPCRGSPLCKVQVYRMKLIQTIKDIIYFALLQWFLTLRYWKDLEQLFSYLCRSKLNFNFKFCIYDCKRSFNPTYFLHPISAVPSDLALKWFLKQKRDSRVLLYHWSISLSSCS